MLRACWIKARGVTAIFVPLLVSILLVLQSAPVSAFDSREQQLIDLGMPFLKYDTPSTLCSNISMPYELPASKGKTGREEPVAADGSIPSGGKVTFSNLAARGQEYRDYYITMRWNYVSWNWDGTSADVDQGQFNWMGEEPRLVLVTNTRTGKSIVAAALEAGPAPWTGVDRQSNNDPKLGWTNPQRGTPENYTGRVSGFPPTAIEALGAEQGTYDGGGDELTYQWAPDQSATPGPVTAATCGSAGENGWAITGNNAMTVYYQNLDPWATQAYGIGTIIGCGCGPTSMAMIVRSLTGYDTDPKKMADFFYNNDGQKPDCGSHWIWDTNESLFESTYGISIEQIATTGVAIKEALSSGSFVLMSQGMGMFTDKGHIMIARGFTNAGNILVADPVSENHTANEEGFTEYQIVGNGSDNLAGRDGDYGYLKGAWKINVPNAD